MKKNILLFTGLMSFLYITLKSDVDGPAHHGHGNVTGATTGTTGHCQTSSCHGGNNPLNIVNLIVSDTSTQMPITHYNALQTYLVTITGNATAITATLPGFGFQASAVLGNHTQSGTFTIPAGLGDSIHTFNCGATTVVEHGMMLPPTAPGSQKYSISFYWTAPVYGSDSTSFYALLNAVNDDGTDGGDNPDAAPVVTIYENPSTEAVATLPAQNNLHLTVSPNPTAGVPTLSYTLETTEKVSLCIYDITGRIIVQMADNELQNIGSHQYHPSISIPGVYVIRLSAGSLSRVLQFIQQ